MLRIKRTRRRWRNRKRIRRSRRRNRKRRRRRRRRNRKRIRRKKRRNRKRRRRSGEGWVGPEGGHNLPLSSHKSSLQC